MTPEEILDAVERMQRPLEPARLEPARLEVPRTPKRFVTLPNGNAVRAVDVVELMAVVDTVGAARLWVLMQDRSRNLAFDFESFADAEKARDDLLLSLEGCLA